MARVDGAAQKIQSKPARKQVQIGGSVRNQPLAGKSFYLDLPSGKNLEFLAKHVKRLGGDVESFLSKEVTCVVSNSQEARKERWGEKQTAAVLKDTQARTQTSVGLGRCYKDPLCKPVDAIRDTVLVTRGRTLLQKAIRSQSKPCGGNSILVSARSWGVQIMHMDEMFSYIQWLDSKRHHSTRQMKRFPSRPQHALKVMRLQSPFLKVEDESRQLRPLLQQFKNFPELYFLALRRHSPFDPPQSPAITKAPEGRPVRSDPSSDYCQVPQRQRGYCECCEEAFAELQMHLRSPRHTAFGLDASHYAVLDNLISQMTNDFAVSSWLPSPRRVPPAAYGDLSGFQGDILERVSASGQSERCCVSSGGSGAQPVSTGTSTHLLEDRSSFRQRKLPWEALSTPAPLALPSLQSPSGWAAGGSDAAHPGSGGAVADAPLNATVSPEVGCWPAPQQKKLWTPLTILSLQPRKRKLSYSPCGQARKRPAVTRKSLSQLLPGINAAHEIPVVGATASPFSHECGTQTNPGRLQLPVVPVANPQLLHASTQFPQEGSSWPPQECTVMDTGGLKGPVQQLERKEGPADCPSKEQHAWTPCQFLSADAGLSVSGFPVGESLPSQLPGSEAQPCSPGIAPSAFVQVVEQFGPGQPPLSCSEASSSSESEWDGPLLCALEGVSRLPLERAIDSALLGTCISLRDSGYESHLSSVLWQTLEPHEACKGDSDGGHSHMEVAPTPFGACLNRLGPF